jgi:hypothetical protein
MNCNSEVMLVSDLTKTDLFSQENGVSPPWKIDTHSQRMSSLMICGATLYPWYLQIIYNILLYRHWYLKLKAQKAKS